MYYTQNQIFTFAERWIVFLKEHFEQTLFWLNVTQYDVSQESLKEDLTSNIAYEYDKVHRNWIDASFLAFVKGYMIFADDADFYYRHVEIECAESPVIYDSRAHDD